jgi:hypothetical protein
MGPFSHPRFIQCSRLISRTGAEVRSLVVCAFRPCRLRIARRPRVGMPTAVQVYGKTLWKLRLFLVLSGILAVMSALWLLPRIRVRAKPEVADEEELAASPYTSN